PIDTRSGGRAGHDALGGLGPSGPSLNSSSFASSAANPHCCGSKKPHSSWIGPDFCGLVSAAGAAGFVIGRGGCAGRPERAAAAAADVGAVAGWWGGGGGGWPPG